MKVQVFLPDKTEALQFLVEAAGELTVLKLTVARWLGDEMRNVAKDEIMRLHAFDTGKLYGGVESVVKGSAGAAGQMVLGRVVSHGTHARVVSDGRKAGTMPRFTSAPRIAKRKRAAGAASAGDVGAFIGSKITPKFRAWAGRNLPPMNDAQLRRAAFLIARKIKRQGIPGRDYLAAAYKAGITKAPEVFESAKFAFEEWAG